MGSMLLLWVGELLIHVILHAVALAFYDDSLCMMQEPVKDSRGKGAVIVEDTGPFFVRPRQKETYSGWSFKPQ